MSWEAWFTLAVIGSAFGFLACTRIAADAVLVAAVTVLMLSDVLSTSEALSGMANEGMVTVGVLYAVVAGLQSTGATSWVVQHLLGRPRTLWGAQLRIMAPIAALSGFLNNTPVVAMFLPAVTDWAKKYRISASKLLIPLSYAAILGGTCTLIGTSTNLVVNGLVIRSGLPQLGMWDITWIGLPYTALGILYILLVGRWLLPDRKPAIGPLTDPREYTVEMLVVEDGGLVGKSIEQAGLRHLPNLYLAEIDRDGEAIVAVSPQTRLCAGDRLLFVGVVDSVLELQKIRGLVPATDQVFKLEGPRPNRRLIEAVVSNSCPLVGKTIREGRFRNYYNAVVIAVARNGERIRRKMGDIVLQTGDTLLLEAAESFVERQRNSRDFFLVSSIEASSPVRHERAALAVLIMLGMVLVVSLEWLSMLKAAFLAAGLMIATRCCRLSDARRSVDWQVLITIAAALGLGRALETSGAASYLAHEMIGLAGGHVLLTLVAVYGATMITTELITNNAAAVLIFPIAMATAAELGVEPMPFIMTIMMAASASFSTPVGYQTNLMVYGIGGYRFGDYLRIGVPLNLLLWTVGCLLIPIIYPL